MNERIKLLRKYALNFCYDNGGEPENLNKEFCEKFAELIVRECAGINYNSSFKDGGFHARELLEHFGVEETQGWVCPNCGTDRTKAACPKGHTAALTGDCPMHGVAHGAAQ